MRWARYVARKGERRGVYRVLEGKPEGKRPLGRPRHTWDDNIKIDLQEVRWRSKNWIDLAQDRDRWIALLKAAIKPRVPLNGGNLTEELLASQRILLHGVSKQASNFPFHAHLA
jgi:hypothetical protein